MVRRFLEELGIAKENIDRILDEHNRDVEREKGKTRAAEAERDGCRGMLDEARARFGGVDVDALTGEVGSLKAALAEAEGRHRAELARRDAEAETALFLSGKRLANPLVAEALAARLNAALGAPEHAGQGRDELFRGLTEDATGAPLPGLFIEENPHRPILQLPPAGHVGPEKLAALTRAQLELNAHRIIQQ